MENTRPYNEFSRGYRSYDARDWHFDYKKNFLYGEYKRNLKDLKSKQEFYRNIKKTPAKALGGKKKKSRLLRRTRWKIKSLTAKVKAFKFQWRSSRRKPYKFRYRNRWYSTGRYRYWKKRR